MKTISFLLMSITVAGLHAQQYEISFYGTGAATIIDSVIIENLNQVVFLTVKGNNVLQLNLPTDVFNNSTDINSLQVYPNPMADRAEILFPVKESGNIQATVYDVSGRPVAQSFLFLQPGMHKYCVTGLNQGIYTIRILEQGSSYTARLISQSKLNGKAEIAHVSSTAMQFCQTQIESKRVKSTASVIEMPYNAGDRLKLTGTYGTYSTVLTAVPSSDETITFEFMECMDADSNHYPVITLGTQTWMAVNLRTTRFSDGTAIPLVTDTTAWSPLTTPAYVWYRNDSVSNKDLYGALYNWYAVDTTGNGGKNLCPSGWHMPTNDEWNTLAKYAGGTAIAGGKLKETGTAHWNSPNTAATNETGFTSLAAGWLAGGTGVFLDMGIYGCWWSATEKNSTNAWYREMDYNNGTAVGYDWYKKCGFSVRCVKD